MHAAPHQAPRRCSARPSPPDSSPSPGPTSRSRSPWACWPSLRGLGLTLLGRRRTHDRLTTLSHPAGRPDDSPPAGRANEFIHRAPSSQLGAHPHQKENVMRRSVRNGLAIAGMAGGVWFLGQAVAQCQMNRRTTSAGQCRPVRDQRGRRRSHRQHRRQRQTTRQRSRRRPSTPMSTAATAERTRPVNTGVQGPSSGLLRRRPLERRRESTSTSRTGRTSPSCRTPTAASVSNSGNVSDLPKLPVPDQTTSQSNKQPDGTSEDDGHGRPHGSGGAGTRPDASRAPSGGHDEGGNANLNGPAEATNSPHRGRHRHRRR